MDIDINQFTLKEYTQKFTLFPEGRKTNRRDFKFDYPLNNWDSFFHCVSFEKDEYKLFIGEKTKSKISWIEFKSQVKVKADYSLLQEIGFPITKTGKVGKELSEVSIKADEVWKFESDALDIEYKLKKNVLIYCRIYDRSILIKNSPHKTFYKYREVENPEIYLEKLQGLWFSLPSEKEMSDYYQSGYFGIADGRELYQISINRLFRGRMRFESLKPEKLKVIEIKKDSFRIAIYSNKYHQSSTEWINFDEYGNLKLKGRGLWFNSRINTKETRPRENGESRKHFMLRDFIAYEVRSSKEAFDYLFKKFQFPVKGSTYRGFGLCAQAVARELQKSGFEIDTDEVPYTLEESKCSSEHILQFYVQIMDKEAEFKEYLTASQEETKSSLLKEFIDMDPSALFTNGKMLQCAGELQANEYLSPETMFDAEKAQEAMMKQAIDQMDENTANFFKKIYSPPGEDTSGKGLMEIITNFENEKIITKNLGTDYNPTVDDLWKKQGDQELFGLSATVLISTRDLENGNMTLTKDWIRSNKLDFEKSLGQKLFDFFKEKEKSSNFTYESNQELLENWNDKRHQYREKGYATQKSWKEELIAESDQEKMFLDTIKEVKTPADLESKFKSMDIFIGDELLTDCPAGRFILKIISWDNNEYQACYENYNLYTLVTGEEIVLGKTYRAGTPFSLLGHTMPALFSLADKEYFPGERLIKTYKWLLDEKDKSEWIEKFKETLVKQIKTAFKDEREILKELECKAHDLIKNLSSFEEISPYLKFTNVTFGGMLSKREGDVSFSITVDYPGDDYKMCNMVFINDYKLMNTPGIGEVFNGLFDDGSVEKKQKKKEKSKNQTNQQENPKTGIQHGKRQKKKKKAKAKLVLDGTKYFAKGKESAFEPLSEEELNTWRTKWKKKLPKHIIALLESQNGGTFKENVFGKAIPLTKIPGISSKGPKNSIGPVSDKTWNSLNSSVYFDNRDVMDFCLGKQEDMFLLDETNEFLLFMDYDRSIINDYGNSQEKPSLSVINKKGYPRKDYLVTFSQMFTKKTGRLRKYQYDLDPMCEKAMAVKKLFSIKVEMPLKEFEEFCKDWAKKTKRAYSKRLFEYCCWHKGFEETMTINKVTPAEVRVLEHFFKAQKIPFSLPEIPPFNLELVCRAVDISDADRVLHTCLRTCKNGFLTYVGGFGGAGEHEDWNCTENREVIWNLNRGLNNR